MCGCADIIASSEDVHLSESQLEDRHLPYRHSLADMVVQNLTSIHYSICNHHMPSTRYFNEE